MKGNITKSLNHKQCRNLIIILVVLMICAAAALSHSKSTENDSYTPKLPEIQLNGDVSYTKSSNATGMLLKATTGLVFESNTYTQSVDFPNNSANEYAFTVSLYLGDGTILYESDYVYPNESITTIQISKQLDKGIYRNAVMVYKCYSTDDSHTIISQCEFPIEIKCV